MYLMPKLYNTKDNNLWRHLWGHIPGVCVHWKYNLGVRRLLSRLFDRRPAWVNPYMPLRISKYMKPVLMRGKRLYWLLLCNYTYAAYRLGYLEV